MGRSERYMPMAKGREVHLFCCEMSESCVLSLGLLFKADLKYPVLVGK